MRVAIITMAYNTAIATNYGNRLQNYALQELLRSICVVPETLYIRLGNVESTEAVVKRNIIALVKLLIRYKHERVIRKHRFLKFNQNHILWSKMYLHANKIIRDCKHEQYDYYIVGSDQVWNTSFPDVQSNIEIYLATFVPPEKRISYAASFGSSQIPDDYKNIFNEELPKYKAISVREAEGVRLVKECGANATVVLDPTMMLTSQEWDELASMPKFAKDGHFILTYFLGGRSDKMNKYISLVTQDRRVIHLDTEFIAREKIENLAAFSAPPDEFVWLFAHADCVLTDSFHGTVFSILYHRPFMVFDRLVNGKKSGMESRIDTLLSTFHLEQCRGNIDNPSGEPIGGDWEEVERILAAEREKSLDFLKKALDLA